jgi:hypothetical protein
MRRAAEMQATPAREPAVGVGVELVPEGAL